MHDPLREPGLATAEAPPEPAGQGSGRRAPCPGASACTTPWRTRPRTLADSGRIASRSFRKQGQPAKRGPLSAWIVRIGYRTGTCAVLRCPLVRTSRALCQLPFVAEQIFEIIVAPFRRRGGPNDLQAAADRLIAVAVAEAVLPTEALLLDRGALGLGGDILLGIRSAVGLAKGVTPGNQRNCFLVVHRHPSERLSDIPCRSDWIWISIRPFRIHVNQSHLHGAERIVEFTIAFITLVSEPLGLRSPVDVFFRFPDIRTPAAETEGLEAH